MKKIILLFIIILITGTCFGQKLQPARRYLSKKGEPKKYYSTRSMKNFTYENKEFRKILFNKTGENDVESMFENTYVVDTTLVAGTYINSGLNPDTEGYEPFLGKEYTGKVTVYENGYQKILLYKNECGNALNIKKGDSYAEDNALRDFQSESESNPRRYRKQPVVQPLVQPVKDEEDWSFRTPKNEPETRINLNLPPVEEPPDSPKKKLHLGWIIIPPAAIGLGIATYFFLKNNLGKSSPDNTSGSGKDPPPPPDPGGSGVDPPPPPP